MELLNLDGTKQRGVLKADLERKLMCLRIIEDPVNTKYSQKQIVKTRLESEIQTLKNYLNYDERKQTSTN